MMSFREWLSRRNGGSKLTATGLNAGGQAQSGMRLRYSVRPPLPRSPSLSRRKLS